MIFDLWPSYAHTYLHRYVLTHVHKHTQGEKEKAPTKSSHDDLCLQYSNEVIETVRFTKVKGPAWATGDLV